MFTQLPNVVTCYSKDVEDIVHVYAHELIKEMWACSLDSVPWANMCGTTARLLRSNYYLVTLQWPVGMTYVPSMTFRWKLVPSGISCGPESLRVLG